ncbi:MAG: trigger factor [Oscillospiraceae bacterium]|jgi:trigger factor|nr:trigger factor [Oscillospiraceae bacterium]
MVLVSKEQRAKNACRLKFEVEAEVFNKHLDAIFAKNVKNMNVPGFRKGKPPRAIVEKIYGANLFFNDALNSLWSDEFDLALKSAEITNFVAVEKIDVLSISKQEGISVCVDIITKPQVELAKYSGLKVQSRTAEIGEKEVDEAVRAWAEKLARIITVNDRPCRVGDQVNINFEGFVDGEALDGGKSENYSLTVGKGDFLKGFEEGLVGHGVGEKFKINVTFPKDYTVPTLCGKAAEFDIKMNSIKAYELPEINDEFAKDASEFDTLKELRADILKKLEEKNDEQRRYEIEERILDEIIGKMTVEVPDVMNERQIDSLVKNFARDLEKQGMDLDGYLKKEGTDLPVFREKFRAKAERQVKAELALEEIAKLESIEVTEGDLQKEIEIFAKQRKLEPEKAKAMIDMKALKEHLLLSKALDFVVESASVELVNVEK